MAHTTDTSAHAAVLRYIEHTAAGHLAAAEASIDGADCAELYSSAAGYATTLLDQFSLEDEAPLGELLDVLVSTAASTWDLDESTAELVAGFSKITGYEGDWNGAAEYVRRVEAAPDEATSAALIYTATLAILVAEASGVEPGAALDLLGVH